MKTFLDSFQRYFLKSFQVVKLDEKLIKELGNDMKALPYALLILALPSFFNYGMASLAFRTFVWPEFLLLMLFVLLNVLMFLFMSYLAQYVFKGKQAYSYKGFLINASLANVLAWILLIPFALLLVGVPVKGLFELMLFVVGIWTFVIFFKLLRILHGLSGFKAFLVVLISILVVAGAQGFLMDIFLGEEYKSILLNRMIT